VFDRFGDYRYAFFTASALAVVRIHIALLRKNAADHRLATRDVTTRDFLPATFDF
jgi:hypothetical protein